MSAVHEEARHLYNLISEVIAGLTYKPDTTFDARLGEGPVPHVDFLIRRQLLDSTAPPGVERVIPVGGTFMVPPAIVWAKYPKEQLLQWIWGLVLDIEHHEAGEWFRSDGVLLHDPHAQNRPIGA